MRCTPIQDAECLATAFWTVWYDDGKDGLLHVLACDEHLTARLEATEPKVRGMRTLGLLECPTDESLVLYGHPEGMSVHA